MADNTIYYDDEPQAPKPRTYNAEATPDYNKIYFDRMRQVKDEQLQAEMAPYMNGLATGDDLEAKAAEITKKYRLPQSDLRFDAWKNGDGPGAHYMGNLEAQVLQAVANKRIGQYNSAMTDMRNRLNAFSAQQYAAINNEYEKASRAYYNGERGEDGKLLYKTPPQFDQKSLNESIEAFKQQALEVATKGIQDSRVRDAVARNFSTEVANYSRRATTDNIKRETRNTKDSYAQYGKSIVEKATSNPAIRYPDMVQEFTNNVSTGVNTNVLTPDEGIDAITRFSDEAKTIKKNHLKKALTPQEGLDPAQNAQKAASLIQDHIDQGVLTPQEAQNLYQESVSQSLAKNESKAVIDQKSMIKESIDTKIMAQQMDVTQKAVIEGLKSGIPPDSGTLNQLYSNADPIMRDKLDKDLSKAYTVAKFSTLPTSMRKELMDNPDLLSTVFYLNDEKDFEALSNQNEALNKAIASDPVKVMMDQKLIENVVPVDTKNYDSLITSLKNRAVLAMKVKAHTGADNTGLLDEEADLLGKQYANANITQKADIVGAIYEAYGEAADTVYKKLDEKGYSSLGLAGSYYAAGNKSAGLDVINGVELDKQNKGLLPPDSQLYAAAQNIPGLIFPDYADDEGFSQYATGTMKTQIIQSAKYIYASKLAKQGTMSTVSVGKDNTAADNFNQKLWTDSLKDAMNGGTIQIGRGRIEPPFNGAGKEDVHNFIKGVKVKDVASIRQLSQMNLLPNEKGTNDKLTELLTEKATWISRGQGVYNVGIPKPSGSGIEILIDSRTGGPAVVDLRKLMTGKSVSDDIPYVDPKYTDLLTHVTASESAARGWSKVREKELIVDSNIKSINEAANKSNFVMSGDGNPKADPNFMMDGKDYSSSNTKASEPVPTTAKEKATQAEKKLKEAKQEVKQERHQASVDKKEAKADAVLERKQARAEEMKVKKALKEEEKRNKPSKKKKNK